MNKLKIFIEQRRISLYVILGVCVITKLFFFLKVKIEYVSVHFFSIEQTEN